MPESKSVKAILSAEDRGFTSTMRNAMGTIGGFGKTVAGGLGFGILSGVGMACFNNIEGAVGDLVGTISSSNAAWKTFEGNMQILGKSEKEINSVKKTMQSYAEATIYSSSDMASTYAQLASVGIKSADSLVTGFGGLAAAAENPTQAMKTLSQQAVQMAAKPNVAWADFKLMLEQTPAGIAAVAKEMGMTTSEMVTAVQDGTIATEDFFEAINKVGNSKGFTDLATEYKTVEDAMGGLQETLANKLSPAFEVLSSKAIGAISGIIDKVGKLDGAAIADKVTAGLKKAEPYFEMFKNILMAVGKALKVVGNFLLEHADIIAKAIPVVLGLVAGYKAFKVVQSVVPAVSRFTTAITGLAKGGLKGIVGKLFGIAGAEKVAGQASQVSAKQVMQAALAFLALAGAVVLICVGIALLAQSAIALAGAGGMAIATMFGMVAAVVALGAGMGLLLKTLAPFGAQLVPVGLAMLALGGAVLLVAVGFALLAQSSIALANAGGAAIAVMFGLVASLAALMALAAVLAPAMTAGAVGFIAFGAAIALVGVGALLAAAALYVVAAVLPTVVQYGAAGAIAIAQLGLGMMAFAAGALLAGVACITLAAGLIAVAAGLAIIGASILIVAAGVLALSAAVLVLAAGAIALGAGLMICATAFTVMAATVPAVAAASLMLVASFTMLAALSLAVGAALMVASAAVLALSAASLAGAAGILAFGAGMLAACAGVLAMNVALKGVSKKMKTISSSAKSSVKSFKSMSSAAKSTKSAISSLSNTAESSMNKVTNAMNRAASKAQSAGRKLGTGFTNGMRAGLAPAPAAANQAVATISAAFSSGSARAYAAGRYIGQGLVNGLRSMLGSVRSIATQIANEVNRAIAKKAELGSPSKLTKQYGRWYGEGLIIGIEDMVAKAQKAAESLVTIPNMSGLSPAMAFGGELSADYDYYKNAEYTIVVPLDVDGREFARATATYTEEELNKRTARNNRKKGRV